MAMESLAFDAESSRPTTGSSGFAWQLLRAAGSLKITVAMFLAATFLLLVGTLAQDEKNLPEVKAEYFNSWLARVPFADFVPVTVFGETNVPGWFPFPGGGTIGLVLLVNLIAAKVTRFHVAAHGKRLLWGTIVSVLGGLLTAGVILTGHRTDGLQGRPPVDYDTVWRMVQMGGAVLAGGLGTAAWLARRRLVAGTLWTAAVAVGTAVALTIAGGESWRMNDPGLRIMWQLIQSSVAAVVLLAGLVMVFGVRGGNVLIHVAVGLLMVGQFLFGDRQIEERISLIEGQTTSVAYRTDETELAVIDPGDTADDRVTAISGRLLAARAGGAPIAIDALPFDIRVIEWFPNSSVIRVGPVAPNPATAGLGKQWLADGRPPEGGTSSRTNIASAYVQLVERGTGRDLGTHLVSQFLNDQDRIFMGGGGDEFDTVEAGGKPWRLALRFRRQQKPYSVTLDDVRRIDYSASATPRDYSSYVTFTDGATKAEQKGRIWMNNPVRYRGETFYQSQYSQVDLGGGRTGEMTGLQVVENAGWLVPYVACVLAFWGMLAHFGLTFIRFADRHERMTAATRKPVGGGWIGPALGLALVAAAVLPRLMERPAPAGSFDWRAAGAIPVMHEGRVKPLDTVARNTLQLLGNRANVRMPDDTAKGPQGSVTATQWLLSLMAGSDWVADAPVFRIDAFEVLDLFDITRRQGHRYSAAELEKGREALRKQLETVRSTPAEQRTFVQKKFLELEQKLMAYDLVRFAYDTPAMPRPSGEGEEARRELFEQVRRLVQGARMINDNHPPAVIPPAEAPPTDGSGGPAENWQALYPAVVTALVGRVLDGREGQPAFKLNPAVLPFTDLLAKLDGPAAEFNSAVKAYQAVITDLPAVQQSAGKAALEAWLNAFNPTDTAKWLYVLATVLCFASFLVGQARLNRFIWWMLLGTLVLHTFALAARIYLTGGQPLLVGGVYRLGLRARRPRARVAPPSRHRQPRRRPQRRAHADGGVWTRLWRHDARAPGRARHAVLALHARGHSDAGLRRHVPRGPARHLLDRADDLVAALGPLARPRGRSRDPGPPPPHDVRRRLLRALLQLHRHGARGSLGR